MFYLGVDVGKYSHSLCLLKDNGQKVIFQADNTRSGYESLAQQLKSIPKDNILIGMEATGHYFLNLYQFFLQQGLKEKQIALLNPLQVKSFRNTNLRGAKSDNIDAERIAVLLRFGDFQRCNVCVDTMLNLRELTRLRYNLRVTSVNIKRKIIAILDRIFPEFLKIFSNQLGKTSLSLISDYPLPEDMAKLSLKELASIVKSLSKRGINKDKIDKLYEASRNSVGISFGKQAFKVELEILIAQLRELNQQVKYLEKRITDIVDELNSPLFTIPGIGKMTGSTILAEIGDISKFGSAIKLIAFAGLDPKLKESGSYQGKTPISKRGSKYLRNAIWYSALTACRVESSFKQKYQERREKGKSHKYAITAAANKLTKVIYHVLKNNCSFQSDLV